VVSRVTSAGMDDSLMVPLNVPTRMLAHFAECEDPAEYAGRILWTGPELAGFWLRVNAQLA
jgi:hypothetical protein